MDEYSDGHRTVTKEKYDEVMEKAQRIKKTGYHHWETGEYHSLFGEAFEVYEGTYYDKKCPTVRFSEFGKNYIWDELSKTQLGEWMPENPHYDACDAEWEEATIWEFIDSQYSTERLGIKIPLNEKACGIFQMTGGVYLSATVHRSGWITVDLCTPKIDDLCVNGALFGDFMQFKVYRNEGETEHCRTTLYFKQTELFGRRL